MAQTGHHMYAIQGTTCACSLWNANISTHLSIPIHTDTPVINWSDN
jgi:hypothetical protein